MLLKKVSEEINQIFAESTLHGIPRILKSKSFLSKLMWAVCFLGATGHCIYLVKLCIDDYLQFNTVVDVAYNSEIPVALPAITICNLNQFQSNSSFEFAKQKPFFDTEDFWKLYTLIDNMLELNETYRDSFSYSLNETLISCHFNSLNCTSADFKKVFVPFNGKCFSFSYDREHLKLSSRIGKINGFSIELFIGNPESIPNFIFSSGFKVFISKIVILIIKTRLIFKIRSSKNTSQN